MENLRLIHACHAPYKPKANDCNTSLFHSNISMWKCQTTHFVSFVYSTVHNPVCDLLTLRAPFCPLQDYILHRRNADFMVLPAEKGISLLPHRTIPCPPLNAQVSPSSAALIFLNRLDSLYIQNKPSFHPLRIHAPSSCCAANSDNI